MPSVSFLVYISLRFQCTWPLFSFWFFVTFADSETSFFRLSLLSTWVLGISSSLVFSLLLLAWVSLSFTQWFFKQISDSVLSNYIYKILQWSFIAWTVKIRPPQISLISFSNPLPISRSQSTTTGLTLKPSHKKPVRSSPHFSSEWSLTLFKSYLPSHFPPRACLDAPAVWDAHLVPHITTCA